MYILFGTNRANYRKIFYFWSFNIIQNIHDFVIIILPHLSSSSWIMQAIARNTNTGGDCGSTKCGAIGFHVVAMHRASGAWRLKPHSLASLYKAFTQIEALRIAKRFEWHCSQRMGVGWTWLTIGIMRHQALGKPLLNLGRVKNAIVLFAFLLSHQISTY